MEMRVELDKRIIPYTGDFRVMISINDLDTDTIKANTLKGVEGQSVRFSKIGKQFDVKEIKEDVVFLRYNPLLLPNFNSFMFISILSLDDVKLKKIVKSYQFINPKLTGDTIDELSKFLYKKHVFSINAKFNQEEFHEKVLEIMSVDDYFDLIPFIKKYVLYDNYSPLTPNSKVRITLNCLNDIKETLLGELIDVAFYKAEETVSRVLKIQEKHLIDGNKEGITTKYKLRRYILKPTKLAWEESNEGRLFFDEQMEDKYRRFHDLSEDMTFPEIREILKISNSTILLFKKHKNEGIKPW